MESIKRRAAELSQTFLHDRRLVASLLDRSSIGAADLVLEIGPGKGIITRELARRCRHVVAVEKDPLLVDVLRRALGHLDNLAVYQGDFLDFPLPRRRYKVFANIPFSRTSAIVARLTSGPAAPLDAYLVMQREAADMFLGVPASSLSSVLLRTRFDLTIVHQFRHLDFIPPPRVDVVLLRFTQRGPPGIAPSDLQLFRDFVVYGFTAWRRCLGDTFADAFGCWRFRRAARQIGLDPTITPSRVAFDQWCALFQHLSEESLATMKGIVSGSERRLRRQQTRGRRGARHRDRDGQDQGCRW